MALNLILTLKPTLILILTLKLTQILTLFSCFMLFFEHRPMIFNLAKLRNSGRVEESHEADRMYERVSVHRLPVNSSHGWLVMRSTRHKQVVSSSQHAVNSSQAKASKHQSRTAAAVITRSPRSSPLLKNCPRKWADNKVNDSATKINKI